MRQFLEKIPDRIRQPALTAVYGIVSGLAAVAFMLAVNHSFAFIWSRLTALGTTGFVVGSLIVMVLSSLIAGLLVARISPGAAGSGIPQLKAAYWTELGALPFRAVLVKFLGGVIAIAGGASLGREGPTVFITGGTAGKVSSWLGFDRRQRRHPTACGAAAGLAAAFNTPLAAISFVLEEILGDLNSRLLGSVVLASVCGAFVVYALLGKQPSFTMPSVDAPTWALYGVVPLAAAMAALAGVTFQRGALGLRRRLAGSRAVARWQTPIIGGLVTWALGATVYLTCGHLGVFGLGYDDLSAALLHGIGWKIAAGLALAKLFATIAGYGSGGCGGIFSPTLFIGAMCGFCVAGAVRPWVPLTGADELILAAVGMSSCFGAVVRAPFTAILMIFEMTHQFGMVPALMIGTLISQGIARLAGPLNFYDEVLQQDGHEIHRIAPPRDLSAWMNMPVGVLANKKPVVIGSLEPAAMRAVLARYSFRCFPVVVDGALRGVVARDEVERALVQHREPVVEPPVLCVADQSLRDVEARMINSSTGLFLVSETEGGPVAGVFTLHDLLRAQAALLD